MTFDEVWNDVENIRITEFMEAIGEKPVRQEGEIITYNAPYDIEELALEMNIHTAGKPTCLVDARRNVWRDSNYTPWQPLMMLVLEMSGIYNPDRLKTMIAETICEHRKKQAEEKRESQPEKIKPKTVPAKPKRKLRF